MIGIDILIGLRFFVCLRESSIFINGVVCPAIFLLKSTIGIVVVFEILKLVIPVCGLTIVRPGLLRVIRLGVVRPVSAFILLVIGRWSSSVLVRPTIWVWIWIGVSLRRLQRRTLIVGASRNLWWNHSCTSSSLLVGVRLRVLVWTKRKRVLKGVLN